MDGRAERVTVLEPALGASQFSGAEAFDWTVASPLPLPLAGLSTRWRDAQAGLLPAPRLLARYPASFSALAFGLLAWSVLTMTALSMPLVWRAGLGIAAGLGLLAAVMGRRLAGWLER